MNLPEHSSLSSPRPDGKASRRQGRGHPVSFLGPSVLYYEVNDDTVAPSGLLSGAKWEFLREGSLNMERWEEKEGANVFLRQDCVVNRFSWELENT